MPETQQYDDYIEPPPRGFVPPPPGPADAFGLQRTAPPPPTPTPLAPAPVEAPPDEVIPPPGAKPMPFALVADQSSPRTPSEVKTGQVAGREIESYAEYKRTHPGVTWDQWVTVAYGGTPQLSDAPPSNPEIRPIGAGGGGAPRVGLVDPKNPMGLPPEAATIVGVIRFSEGTARKQGYTLFGGQDFVPGYEHPAREGWQGNAAMNTHAAGPGQWQPGTWEDEKKRAAAQGIELDFGKGAHQDWAIWDRSSRLYKDATGRDLAADIRAGKADYSVLGSEWQGLARGTGSTTLRGRMMGMSPGLQEMARNLEGGAEDARNKYHSEISELMRQANEAPAGSKERDDAIHALRKREEKYMDDYERIANHPPVMKPVDALSNFGSAGTIVALLGGLFARRHMTAALGAAGEAMKAINQNNWDQFQQQYKLWDHQSTTALNMVKLHNEQIRELIDDKRMAVDEKNTKIRFAFEGLGQQRLADMMAQGAHSEAFREAASLERAERVASQQKAMFDKAAFDAAYARHKAGGEKDDEAQYNALVDLGKIKPGGQMTPAKQQAAELEREIKRRDDKFVKDNPSSTEEQRAEAHHKNDLSARSEMALATARSPTGQLSEDSVKLLAKQYEMGDMGVITSLPRGGPGRIQVENQIAEDMKGLEDGPRQIVMNRLRMAEAKAAATTAGRVTMNTEVYSQEAKDAGQEVIRTSNLFPRTDIPKVNEAIAAFERGTGDPKIIQFGVAVNALRNAYGKLSNPTGIGVHDADKDKFAQIMDTSLSKGQISAGVEQIIREGVIVSNAARHAQEEVLGGIAPRTPGTTPPQSPSAAPVGAESGRGAATSNPADELKHVKEAIAAGAPRDAARAEYIKRGGNPADFDREVPR